MKFYIQNKKVKNSNSQNIYEEYRDRLLNSQLSILKLEIYETFAGTDFINNTLDLVQSLQDDSNETILEELQEIKENICNNTSNKYSDIERTGYLHIIDGYILRFQEETRRLKEKR